MNLYYVTKDSHRLDLHYDVGVDFRLGRGIDISDPDEPTTAYSPFLSGDAPPETVFGADDHTGSLSHFAESNYSRSEARRLYVNLRATYGLNSLSMAMQQVHEEQQHQRSIYGLIENFGQGVAIHDRPSWTEAPEGEQIEDDDLRIQRFISSYGTHYIREIQFGYRIAIRASLQNSSSLDFSSLSADFQATVGAFGASGGVSFSESRSFEEEGVNIDAEVAGTIEPDRPRVLRSASEIDALFDDLKSGATTIRAVPIRATLKSYWHSLSDSDHPRLFADLQPRPFTPSNAPFGVPRGTILPWAPTPDHVEETEDEEVRISPPAGWALCDGTPPAPDLRGRFVVGTMNATDVLASAGSSEHSHSVSLDSGGQRSESRGGNTRAGTAIGDHRHRLSGNTETSSSLPPHVKVVYIMKL